MNLLLLINGRADVMLQKNGIDSNNTEVVKIDDKVFADYGAIMKLLKAKQYDAVYYGAIDKDLQRFQTFMNAYTMLSGIGKGAIIDEAGRQNQYSFFKLVLKELPLFLIEILFSGVVLVYSYIKYPFAKWQMIKGK